MSPKFQAPRGTHDVLPAEQPLWQRVTGTLAEVAELYGYRRIQTPNFEDTDLFQRTSGQGSDIVQKEMYTFTDQGDRSLTLRPEGTAPIARAYVEHGMHRDPQPVKLYTVAPMYRYAAPQKGRYREHWQCSVEAIGSSDPALDADLSSSRSSRAGSDHAVRAVAQLDRRRARAGRRTPTGSPCMARRARRCRRRRAPAGHEPAASRREEPRREAFRAAGKIGSRSAPSAPRTSPRCRYWTRTASLHAEPTLVRGLDYYTRTVFEFVGPEEKAQSAICSGGRYDGLVAEIGGPPTPGIGFGAGIERAILALEQEGVTAAGPALDVFFVVDGAPREGVLTVMAELRRRGLACDTDYAGRSFKGQMTQAGRTAARSVVIAGPDGFRVRSGGEDRAVAPDDLLDTLSR